MDQNKQREIARKGGKAAHRKGTAHEFTTEEARFAGRKGGQQVAANRSHMIEIGRLGGRRSAERRRNRALANTSAPVVVETHVKTAQLESEPASAGLVRQYGAETEQTRQPVMDEPEENRQTEN